MQAHRAAQTMWWTEITEKYNTCARFSQSVCVRNDRGHKYIKICAK